MGILEFELIIISIYVSHPPPTSVHFRLLVFCCLRRQLATEPLGLQSFGVGARRYSPRGQTGFFLGRQVATILSFSPPWSMARCCARKHNAVMPRARNTEERRRSLGSCANRRARSDCEPRSCRCFGDRKEPKSSVVFHARQVH